MIRATLAVILLFGALSSALAVGKQPAPNIQFSTDRFDLAATSLPRMFMGNSPSNLHQALLRGKPSEKGEFETTAQFEARQAAFSERPLLERLTSQDPIAISISPPPRQFDISLKYDADAARMMLQLSKAYFPRECSLPLQSNSRKTGSYIGANAFGAKIKVTKHEVDYLCLTGADDTKVDFPLARDKDERVKATLRVLLVGQLVPPYASQAENYSSATISSPEEVMYRTYVLHMNVEQVWVYDWMTGEVVYRPGMREPGVDLSASIPNPVQSIDQNGNNLIHQAIWTDRYASAEGYIKRNDGDVNGRNKFGATPLHMAVWKKQAKLVALLLAAGADKSIRDNDGKTPVDDAMDKGQAEIAALLR